ncbi:MAG: efflux RND transporter periplasmic adaptor subunit [Bryobacteraceae bacterium]
MTLRIAVSLPLAAGLTLLAGCSAKPAAAPTAMPPPNVEVVDVVQKDVPIYGDWVATLDGYVNAQIQPQVSGYLIRQDYREGSLVHKDDVLFEIDPRPFQAALDQAKGQLAQAKGQLAQAVAQLGLSEINVKRDTPLAAARAIAQSQLDNDIQAKAQNQAMVQTAHAAIEAAQAAVEQAQLNLGFTQVRSLIEGIAGIATVQIGNLVSQSTVLTSVSQVDPIKVYFPISEQEYMHVAEKIKPGAIGDLIGPSKSVPLQLTLANGNIYPRAGRIVFADRQVNPQTGTIQIVGAFPNPGNILRPGQFGRVRAMTGFRKGALLVPQKAVSEVQGRYHIAVVGPDNKVSIREIETGDRVGGMWIIERGLRPGDRVVSEGTTKVRDGATVNPRPDTSQVEGQ